MESRIMAKKVCVSQVIVQEDLISEALDKANHVDCYQFELEAAQALDARELQRKLWSTQPWLVEKLLAIRDCLVKPLGLMTGHPLTEEWLKQGKRSRKLYESGKLVDEQVISVDDKHLRFTVSMKTISWPQTMQKRVVVTTAVYWHNLLGRLYFAAIRLVHGQVVTMSMKYILRKEIKAK